MNLKNIDMSTRKEMLGIIRKAKSSHIRWRSYAQGMVAGVEIQEEKAPVQHTDCKFGQWYYGEGAARLGHLEIFEDIASPHEMLHAIYGQIHEMVHKGEMEQARKKLDEMIGVSRTLLEQISLLEDEVNAEVDE